MSWLGKLFGRGERAIVAVPQPAEADPGNPVHALLEAAGLPWRLTRHDLAARFAVTTDPLYGDEVIELRTQPPLVEGLMRPLSLRVSPGLSPIAPATEYSGVAWFSDDARENLHRTARQLEPALGPARIEEEANTIVCRWPSGPASVELIGWPADLQHDPPGSNHAHEREPRLAAACHILVKSGLRLAPTEEEAAWLAGFQPIAELPDAARSAGEVTNAPAVESELEFVREPGPELQAIVGRVGISPGGEALIFCARQLCLVRLADLVRFEVERMLPAKGPGGAWLSVRCRTGLRDDPEKALSLAAAAGPDELTPLAHRLAAATGRPLRVGEPSYDV